MWLALFAFLLARFPIEFWVECVLTAAYLINCTPTHLLMGKTPYECLFRASPSFDNICVFGCLSYARLQDRTKDKFGPRSRRCVFVGYPFAKKSGSLMTWTTRKFRKSRCQMF